MLEWWDAVLQKRLAWALFCCHQLLCVISQQSWFGHFCFKHFPILLHPPQMVKISETDVRRGDLDPVSSHLLSKLPNPSPTVGSKNILVQTTRISPSPDRAWLTDLSWDKALLVKTAVYFLWLCTVVSPVSWEGVSFWWLQDHDDYDSDDDEPKKKKEWVYDSVQLVFWRN